MSREERIKVLTNLIYTLSIHHLGGGDEIMETIQDLKKLDEIEKKVNSDIDEYRFNIYDEPCGRFNEAQEILNLIGGKEESMKKEEIEDTKTYIENEIRQNKLINGYTDIQLFEKEVENLLKYVKELEADNYEANNIINDYIEDRRDLIEYLKHEIGTMGSGSSMFIVKTALQVVLEKIEGGK